MTLPDQTDLPEGVLDTFSANFPAGELIAWEALFGKKLILVVGEVATQNGRILVEGLRPTKKDLLKTPKALLRTYEDHPVVLLRR